MVRLELGQILIQQPFETCNWGYFPRSLRFQVNLVDARCSAYGKGRTKERRTERNLSKQQCAGDQSKMVNTKR